MLLLRSHFQEIVNFTSLILIKWLSNFYIDSKINFLIFFNRFQRTKHSISMFIFLSPLYLNISHMCYLVTYVLQNLYLSFLEEIKEAFIIISMHAINIKVCSHSVALHHLIEFHLHSLVLPFYSSSFYIIILLVLGCGVCMCAYACGHM